MSEGSESKKRHFILEHLAKTESFKKPQARITPKTPPERDRQRHGRTLLRQVGNLATDMETARQAQIAAVASQITTQVTVET